MDEESYESSEINLNLENIDKHKEKFKKLQRQFTKVSDNLIDEGKYDQIIDRNILFGDRKC